LLSQWSRISFVVIVCIFLAGLLTTLLALESGLRIAGLGLFALGVWLLRFDIARRTIRSAGLTRFIAACLLPGYVWLIIGGLLWLIYGGQFVAGPIYDAMLHVIFLGFVFSMIFGHAPIIIPAVLDSPLSYSPHFYVHLSLLHFSLFLRVAGDLMLSVPLRRWGGVLNEVAIVLFLIVTVIALIGGRKRA
jgi:hypothetical protein